MLLLAILAWLLSLKHNNVTLIDSVWAIFFLVGIWVTLVFITPANPRPYLLLGLVTLWSCRLSLHLHIRNHNKPEDFRYQAIRARNEPNFRFKSLYLVFILQAILAWLISLPLNVVMQSANTLNIFDYIGMMLWLMGMCWQVMGDMQLAKFKAKADNKNKVLNTGVWRYTRHPNYFGESCIWWGYGFFAIAAGGWWSVISPIFMTYLLIKVTGVKLLEADIAIRRPDYLDYIKKTSTFVPWLPKS